jgi:hypothetical protein
MAQKKHLKLLNQKQLEKVVKVKFHYGFPSPNDDDEPKAEPNYYYMATSLRTSVTRFFSEQKEKYELKRKELEIPAFIDFVQLNFVDQFVISEYYREYYDVFGLEGATFSNFGRTGLFAITNRKKFERFIQNVNSFIEFGLNINAEATFSKYITYINSFKLLTAKDIIRFKVEEIGKVVYLSIIELPLDYKLQQALVESVRKYLDSEGLSYTFIELENRIELIDVEFETIKTIAENFDIIQSVTCSLSSTVGPSSYNVINRDYGFTIANPDDELPIIGIIDTGISMSAPISTIVIPDNSFSIDGDSLIDVAGIHRNGHGTAVAALAALGRANHLNQFQGTVNADAKLLSLKISNNGSGYIKESQLLTMLYAACEKYADLKFFVLTMCYKKFKAKNETFSEYTYELDKFAHQTGSLIFICTANNNNAINDNTDFNLEYFNSPHTNLCTPADSLNNVTVGAAAENLNNDVFYGISPGREYPAMYTRKGHIDLKAIYPKTKTNRNYFKPDVIECGGDIGYYNSTTLDWTDDAAMVSLSARPEIGFVRDTGTSFSAPLVANLAAKILNEYPKLRVQTIKALIINGASLTNITFPKALIELQKSVAGHGFVDIEKSLHSTENSPTLILEDTIKDNEMRIYPVNFPDYLVTEALGRIKSILKFTATLCFSFEPIKNNQLSYNPIHIAFSFFRNHSAEQIVSKNDENNSKLRSNLSWSQNGRHVSKPIPYANTQKLSFSVDVGQLRSENQTLKLAVQARLTNQVIGELPKDYPKEFPFSLVITIEENLPKNTGKLYDETQLVNNLEVIQDIVLEGSLEVS